MFREVGISLSKNAIPNILFNFKQIRLKHDWVVPQGYDTGIRVHNRITGDKVPLIFLNKHFVKWYICGPTVYNTSHIGHASSFVRFDIIRRILEQFFDIKPVVAYGITDIDDKIINKAKMSNLDFRLIAKKYELEFFEHVNELNILPPSFILRVSDHIPEVIEFVSRIVEQGKGYPTKSGSVYFDAEKFENYGKLNPIPSKGSEGLKEGQKSFLDFVLWKEAKPNEPFWESPWGRGRPGWHIECSAMASKVFGPRLDLHSGGIDLVFPHHENEEAQSCSYHDCDQWVNYWLHSGQLEVNWEKMSKSLLNFITIDEFLKTYTADNFRMFCFISHYRRALHYSSDSMNLPVESCNWISAFLADANSYVRGNWAKGNVSESILLQELEETSAKVKEHLMNDFDTAGCFVSLMQLMKTTSKMLNEEESSSGSRSPGAVAAVVNYVSEVFKAFGFRLGSVGVAQESKDQSRLEFILNTAVNFRSQVRGEALSLQDKSLKQNLLKACDSFRDGLGTAGITIKDLKNNSSSWIIEDVKTEVEKTQAESVT